MAPHHICEFAMLQQLLDDKVYLLWCYFTSYLIANKDYVVNKNV